MYNSPNAPWENVDKMQQPNWLTHFNNNVLWSNVCYNHHILNIIWRILILTNNYAKGLIFKHKILNNIKKIYQRAGKCVDQQNLKNIIDADMVLTPKGVTD